MPRKPILRYWGYWDIPREVVVEHSGRLYLLECRFDEALDDYAATFDVFRLDREVYRRFTRREVDYNQLMHAATRVGEIPVAGVTFDPTRRRAIEVDDAVFDGVPRD